MTCSVVPIREPASKAGIFTELWMARRIAKLEKLVDSLERCMSMVHRRLDALETTVQLHQRTIAGLLQEPRNAGGCLTTVQ